MENKNLEFYLCKFSSSSSYEEASASLSLPPLLKRKLSRLDKIAFFTLKECLLECKDEKPQIVFASRWAEFDRLLKLICQYKEDNEVSPNAFSSSVHNFPVSYFSILNKIHAPYSSLAAGEDTLPLGLLSAIFSIKPVNSLIFNYSDVFSYGSNEECASVSCVFSSSYKENFRHLVLRAKPSGCGKNFGYTDFISFLKGERSEIISKYFILEEIK